jgi:DNA-directed RNA polymerase subunit RPC12/RpoP
MIFNTTIDKSKNCPQCADSLEVRLQHSKLVKCRSCGSSIFLEDEAVTLIGKSSVLSPEPSLITLYTPFTYQSKRYLPLGKIRYSYGRGFWEEWFLNDEKNKEFWLSIDEGDFVLEEKVKLLFPFKRNSKFTVGRKYGKYLITEKGEGLCVGFEGELPENIHIDEKHNYIHLSEGEGKLLTIEFNKNKTQMFQGKWINPLDIKVSR